MDTLRLMTETLAPASCSGHGAWNSTTATCSCDAGYGNDVDWYSLPSDGDTGCYFPYQIRDMLVLAYLISGALATCTVSLTWHWLFAVTRARLSRDPKALRRVKYTNFRLVYLQSCGATATALGMLFCGLAMITSDVRLGYDLSITLPMIPAYGSFWYMAHYFLQQFVNIVMNNLATSGMNAAELKVKFRRSDTIFTSTMFAGFLMQVVPWLTGCSRARASPEQRTHNLVSLVGMLLSVAALTGKLITQVPCLHSSSV